MNDEIRPTPTEPVAPIDASAVAPAPTGVDDANRAPAATFSGRTPRKTHAVRAGMVVGTGLLVVVGAAVAMGASPSSPPTTIPAGAGQAQTAPGDVSTDSGPFGPGDGRGFLKGGPGRGDVRGFGPISVTAIDGSNVSLATADGWTRTIAVTSTTTITKGGVAATLADLEVGDTIRFAQTRNDDGTYTITAIGIVQPQVAGTVTAVGADSITITLRDGTSQTVTTTGTTAYHVEKADGTRADVTVGSVIVATGEKNADGSLTASSVWVHLPHLAGTVASTTTDTITVTRRDGTTVTVHVGSATTIRVPGVESPTIADVKVGMVIVVEGKQRADGSIDATAIGAGDRGKVRDHDGRKGVKPDASTSPSPSGGTEG